MTIFQEFKKFIMRGNVVDLAIAVTIGATFAKIISSLVADIITPPIGLLLRGVNLKSLKWVIQAADGTTPEIAIGYGNFIQASIEFLVVATVIFAVVKIVNRFRPKEEKPMTQKQITDEAKLLTEIRDLLKRRLA
ncbi:large-conductance mechanosensitive channel protein MscL [Patescibacteria group bacterium]|jgi:large conductance mechanosensitive channel|nr:large-conductance mechanosensitive channel protein MscL [Patescibacteria group bacterium]